MTKQIRTSLAALAVIVAGSAFLSTPAQAAEFGACSLTRMINMSDAYCGGGDFSISNISDSADSCSWTVTCY